MTHTKEAAPGSPILSVSNLNLHYGETQALKGINLDMAMNQVTAFIGPSGCGKSTLLRCFNRMNDLVESCRIVGNIRFNGKEINEDATDVIALRRSIGMVFQQSNPFPKSIYENIVYGLRIAGVNDKATLDEAVERSLKSAAIWNEVKDRLNDSAIGLSGGQAQRICIARAIAVNLSLIHI